MRRKPRRGAVLLEAIAAMAILAIAGVAAMDLARQSSQIVWTTGAAEVELMRASRFLDAVALWPTADLDRRLGSHTQGAWQLEIQKSGKVYRVVLSDFASGRVLLATALYRRRTRGPRLDVP